MKLFKPATAQNAFAKVGILGFAGSGKTFTATNIAIGLAKIGPKKPVAMLDTENGSDYVIPRMKDAGIELVTLKSRAFVDLLAATDEAEKEFSVFIIDSISHFWTELMAAYTKKKKVERLQFQHWADVKKEWGQFTDRFLNSKLHIIMAGRAGYVYEFLKEEDGTKELIKTGTRMKVENELGYEPSLLLEMERLVPNTDEAGRMLQIGGKTTHRCHILKDRSNQLDGQSIDDPTFASFAPIWKTLNLGGEHFAVDTTRTSEAMFDSPKTSSTEWARRRQIAFEEMTGVIAKYLPGSTAREKAIKLAATEAIFGTTSGTAIESMSIERLTDGRISMENVLRSIAEGSKLPEKPAEIKDWIDTFLASRGPTPAASADVQVDEVQMV